MAHNTCSTGFLGSLSSGATMSDAEVAFRTLREIQSLAQSAWTLASFRSPIPSSLRLLSQVELRALYLLLHYHHESLTFRECQLIRDRSSFLRDVLRHGHAPNPDQVPSLAL